jgi:hypothetical protein
MVTLVLPPSVETINFLLSSPFSSPIFNLLRFQPYTNVNFFDNFLQHLHFALIKI